MARGGRRHGAGRPPMPESRRRSASVSVALTCGEYEQLSRAAESSGVTLSDYLRRLLTRHLARKEKRL